MSGFVGDLLCHEGIDFVHYIRFLYESYVSKSFLRKEKSQNSTNSHSFPKITSPDFLRGPTSDKLKTMIGWMVLQINQDVHIFSQKIIKQCKANSLSSVRPMLFQIQTVGKYFLKIYLHFDILHLENQACFNESPEVWSVHIWTGQIQSSHCKCSVSLVFISEWLEVFLGHAYFGPRRQEWRKTSKGPY